MQTTQKTLTLPKKSRRNKSISQLNNLGQQCATIQKPTKRRPLVTKWYLC